MAITKAFSVPTTALISNFTQINIDVASQNLTIAFFLTYLGQNVPGGFMLSDLTVTIPFASLLTGQATAITNAIVSAVQQDASNRGFTVATGNTVLPAWTSQ